MSWVTNHHSYSMTWAHQHMRDLQNGSKKKHKDYCSPAVRPTRATPPLPGESTTNVATHSRAKHMHTTAPGSSVGFAHLCLCVRER
jgi:hypothetical protein